MNLAKAELEVLKHALGANDYAKKSDWGKRNYYLAGPGHHSIDALTSLVNEGLMTAKQSPWRDDAHYYYATEGGCKAAGMSAAAIKRAVEKGTVR